MIGFANTYAAPQRLLRKQGVSARSVAVQVKFVRKWGAWFLIVTALALFYVWLRVQVVQLGYENATLKRESEKLGKEISGLEIEIAKLKSPARLEEVAKKRLGMNSPSAEQVVIIK